MFTSVVTPCSSVGADGAIVTICISAFDVNALGCGEDGDCKITCPVVRWTACAFCGDATAGVGERPAASWCLILGLFLLCFCIDCTNNLPARCCADENGAAEDDGGKSVGACGNNDSGDVTPLTG